MSNMRGDLFPGKDGTSINIIKKIKEHVANILVHIFNIILVESSIPQYFKLVKVSTIHKGGDRSDISSYRPISLLHVFWENFSLKYLKENTVVPPLQ